MMNEKLKIKTDARNQDLQSKSDFEPVVKPICQHHTDQIIYWADGRTPRTSVLIDCPHKAKFIIHYAGSDKYACGIHANAYNKRAKRNGWKLAEPLANPV
jgi:endonuclease YncB( thermonuclease family)